MSVRQLSTVLDGVAIRRISGGDELVLAMNRIVGRGLFNREMDGDDLQDAMVQVSVEMKATLDDLCQMDNTRLSQLLDEVYRIKEEADYGGVSAKEAVVNSTVIAIVLFCVLAAFGLVTLLDSYLTTHGIAHTPVVVISATAFFSFIVDLMSKN